MQCYVAVSVFLVQMAYESLALISSALSRLDCGQLGVCRYVFVGWSLGSA